MTYAEGFAAGERASYADRATGQHTRRHLGPIRDEWQRGFADGYAPRSPAWGSVDTKGRPMWQGAPCSTT